MNAIDKVIQIAENEVGYLEKKSNSQLESKTANAGSKNYTKYWQAIKPPYQGQPWCACFVTWCFVQAFGAGTAARLLKHYPYVYCPTMEHLFSLNANPKRGDIVIFKHNGTFTHTGIVTGVNGDYFTTVEGNTSNGSTIIANGGAVCKKGYYNSKLPGTKFCTPDWRVVDGKENLTMTQYEELKKELASVKAEVEKLNNKMVYDYIDNNLPGWARPTIQKLVGNGYLKGDENGKLNLTDDLLRILVITDRAGMYDHRWDGQAG